MSQGSQGPFAAGRTILPLAKFSYATVHGESKTPIPWFHMGRTENLFAIFESQQGEDNRGQARDVKKFKVLNDPEVLVWTVQKMALGIPKVTSCRHLPMIRKTLTSMSWQAKRTVQKRKLKMPGRMTSS
jgi:hypothetical protein